MYRASFFILQPIEKFLLIKCIRMGHKREEPLQLRNKAIFELLYSSGLRVSELVQLDVENVQKQKGILRILGKGSKERIVPVGEQAQSAITYYLEHGRPLLVKGKSFSRSMFFGLRLSFLTVASAASSPYNNADHDIPTAPVEFLKKHFAGAASFKRFGFVFAESVIR